MFAPNIHKTVHCPQVYNAPPPPPPQFIYVAKEIYTCHDSYVQPKLPDINNYTGSAVVPLFHLLIHDTIA